VTYTGTHQGEFVGIPATGKQTTTNGVDLFGMLRAVSRAAALPRRP
jgi:predicted ester cyclase